MNGDIIYYCLNHNYKLYKKELMLVAKIEYFQPPEFQTPENKIALKYVPRSIEEGYKVDLAEKKLSEELYVRVLALALVHDAYQYLPKKHQETIKQLVDYGIFDQLAVSCQTNLTDNYVANGKFFYNNIEYTLPGEYVAKVRVVDKDGSIYVAACNNKGKRRVYQFIHNGKNYNWRRIDNKQVEFLVDF